MRKDQIDTQFERQLDAIRDIELEKTPDVVDAVMQRVNAMPALVPVPRRRHVISIVSSAVAACFVIAVVSTYAISLFKYNNVQAATPSHDLSYRFFDVYEYCNDYADQESVESAAYYDNPVIDFYETNQ